SAPTTSRAGSRPTLDPRPVVVQPKQRHDRRDVRLVADEVADPSGLREDVMRLRPAEGDELVAHEQREGQVGEPVAVHMAQLAPAVSELSPAEPVPTDRHAGPRRHFPHDGVVNGFAQRLYSILDVTVSSVRFRVLRGRAFSSKASPRRTRRLTEVAAHYCPAA